MGRVTRRGPAVRQQAIEILKNGGTIDEAATVTGFGRNYVRQLGAKNGIRFPRGKYGPRKSCKYDHNLIFKLYEEGKKLEDIAEAVGSCKGTVYTTLVRAGKYVKPKKQIVVIANEMRFCKECNAVFLCDPRLNKIFCSEQCQRANSHKKHDPLRRARKLNAAVDDDITLEEVARRNNDICYLCGEKVDWQDFKYVNGKKCVMARYPSMDHVVALANGGLHTWSNIKLAHHGCNASKGVREVG